MKYQTEVVELEGVRFEVPLLGKPLYSGPLGKLYSTPKGGQTFADSKKWDRVASSAFGQSGVYRDKIIEDVEREVDMMDIEWSNDRWRAAHRTSQDYQNYLETNQRRVW